MDKFTLEINWEKTVVDSFIIKENGVVECTIGGKEDALYTVFPSAFVPVKEYTFTRPNNETPVNWREWNDVDYRKNRGKFYKHAAESPFVTDNSRYMLAHIGDGVYRLISESGNIWSNENCFDDDEWVEVT